MSEVRTYGMECPHAEKAMQFLALIGVPVTVSPGARGFIEGVSIVDGALHVDPGVRASGLLHEAGHLAIVPTQFRSYLSGNLNSGMKRIVAELDALGLEPDSPLERAILQTGDPEATAWAWAAGKTIGIPDEMIVQDDEYSGEGPFIRVALAANSYVGIHGISHSGFCVPRPNSYRNLPVYPELAFWLQK